MKIPNKYTVSEAVREARRNTANKRWSTTREVMLSYLDKARAAIPADAMAARGKKMGSNRLGVKASDETKARMSEAAKGRTQTEEHIAKRTAALKATWAKKNANVEA